MDLEKAGFFLACSPHFANREEYLSYLWCLITDWSRATELPPGFEEEMDRAIPPGFVCTVLCATCGSTCVRCGEGVACTGCGRAWTIRG